MEAKGNSGKTVAKFALTATAMATTAVVKVVGEGAGDDGDESSVDDRGQRKRQWRQ